MTIEAKLEPISIRETASRLKATRQQAYLWIWDGKISAVKSQDGRWLVDAASVERLRRKREAWFRARDEAAAIDVPAA